jgi:tetratricopeptide (TPR) repeat protein
MSLVSCLGFFVSCLVFSFVLSGCSSSYQGERLYWKAHQSATGFGKNVSNLSAMQYEAAIEKYARVVEAVPQTYWAARAQLEIGALYASQGRFEDARQAYTWVLENKHQTRLGLNARLAIARTYEIQKNWKQLILAYKEISEYYPWHREGFSALLKVAQLHQRQGHLPNARKAYKSAVRTYQLRSERAPSPALAARAQGYLGLAYQQMEQWEKALEVFEALARNSSEGVDRPGVLLRIGAIYEEQLGDLEKAKVYYVRLIEEFPEHPLGGQMRTRLSELTP